MHRNDRSKGQPSWHRIVRVRLELFKDYSQAQVVMDNLEASREADEPETSG